MVQMQLSQRKELPEVRKEPPSFRITETGDVVAVRLRRRDRTADQLLQRRTVKARPKPVRRQVFSFRQVVFPGVLHREEFGECPSEACQQPVRIRLYRELRILALLGEIRDHLGNDVRGQPVQVKLHRMRCPVATPVIVENDTLRHVILINAVGEELLNSLILGEGDVRATVEDEAAVEQDGGRMASGIPAGVEDGGGYPRRMKAVSCTEAPHAATDHDDVLHYDRTLL